MFGVISIISVVIIASLALSVSLPLFTYSAGLAVFGLAHVVREFYFIDHRFGARIARPFALSLGALLFMIMLTRIASVFGFLPVSMTHPIELGLVALLAMSSQLYMPQVSITARLISTSIALLIAFGFLASPTATIVVLAVLHNLTPIGFIVDIVPAKHKKFALSSSLLFFVALPMLIASGAFHVVTDLFGQHTNFTIFPTGPLENHLGVFLPSSMRDMPWAAQAFSAVVFAQCMHYVAVIYVMPKLLRTYSLAHEHKPYMPWPKTNVIWLIIVVTSAVLTLMYTRNFTYARSLYGIAAAMHAYIEIPLLLWAFSTLGHTRDHEPMSLRQKSALS